MSCSIAGFHIDSLCTYNMNILSLDVLKQTQQLDAKL